MNVAMMMGLACDSLSGQFVVLPAHNAQPAALWRCFTPCEIWTKFDSLNDPPIIALLLEHELPLSFV